MPPEAGRPASGGVPWQFLVRATAVITGLVLLLIVDVRGAAFFVAWSLIVLALASEAAATLVYWLRSRGQSSLRRLRARRVLRGAARVSPSWLLRPITDANRADAEALGVTPAQEQFVSSVSESLLEAAAEPDGRAISLGGLLRRDPRRVRDDQRRGRTSRLHPALPLEAADRRAPPAPRPRHGDARPGRRVLPRPPRRRAAVHQRRTRATAAPSRSTSATASSGPATSCSTTSCCSRCGCAERVLTPTLRADEVQAWLEPRADEMAELLEQLVAIDTENPPGRGLGRCGRCCALRWTGSASRPS